jgi:hypothetical protein
MNAPMSAQPTPLAAEGEMRDLHAHFRDASRGPNPLRWLSQAGIGVGSALVGAFHALTRENAK